MFSGVLTLRNPVCGTELGRIVVRDTGTRLYSTNRSGSRSPTLDGVVLGRTNSSPVWGEGRPFKSTVKVFASP